MPEDFEDLPDDEQQEIMPRLEEIVAVVNPAALREEIHRLGRLIDHARRLEAGEVESSPSCGGDPRAGLRDPR